MDIYLSVSYEFTAQSISESILEIGHYLAKLETKE